ncbi:hypothetical protein R1flu_022282 [Riccia fluitans]|uniref:Uncharacterized protein n=1 Tax=Riccia fluitans TaxID=41844 RepID=A0ABD1ZUT5_9MARC
MKCPVVHSRAESEAEAEVLDNTLSQNLCVYKEIFNNEQECFCKATRTRLQVAARKRFALTEVETKKSKKERSNDAKEKETKKKPQKRKEPAKRRVSAKAMDVSLTIGIVVADIQGETFDKVAEFINQNARMGIITLERDDAHLLLHIQGMISLKASSTRSLKADLRSVIGREENTPLEHLSASKLSGTEGFIQL